MSLKEGTVVVATEEAPFETVLLFSSHTFA